MVRINQELLASKRSQQNLLEITAQLEEKGKMLEAANLELIDKLRDKEQRIDALQNENMFLVQKGATEASGERMEATNRNLKEENEALWNDVDRMEHEIRELRLDIESLQKARQQQ